MRISRFSALAVLATLALAPVANAMPYPTDFFGGHRQDVRSSDAHHSAAQQDLAHLRAGGTTSKPHSEPALAQEKYYSSYGRAAPVHRAVATADDSSPWLALGVGLGLIALVAALVAVAVRTRRRTVRVAV